MKNKIKSILLLMLIVPCLFLFVACGKDNGNQNGSNNNNQTGNEDDSNVKSYSEGLAYVLSSDETYYIVTGIGSCEDSKVVIPSTYKNKPVKEIKAKAFDDCMFLTSVTIGNNVTSIGEDAFRGCSTLTSVTIGNNVTSIGENAFNCCENLVEIYNLSSLNIEKGSIDNGGVGHYAKDIYTSLDEPSKLKTSNGMIYYVSDDEKIAMKPVDVFSPSVIIEEDCTEICEYVFQLPWLTEIYNLSSIDIESMVYGDLYIYTSLDEPSKLKTSNGMIYYVNDKEKIAIRPETIKLDIENNCFVFDKEVIVIDDDCTRIGKYAFCDINLTSITIPNSVTSIGNHAFEYCSSLTSVYYTGTIEDWCNITFSYYYSNPMYYASQFYIKNSNGEYEELTEIEIPNTITEIKDYAFYRFKNVTKVTIGNNVTSIGGWAFSNCVNLTSITIPNSVTNIGYYAFLGCSSLTKVYYNGTSSDWDKISFSYNSSLENVTRYYYCETKPTGSGNYWHYDTDGTTILEW